MQLDRIRDAIRQQPFHAFRIAMANGSSYLVEHSEFIAMPQTARKRSIAFYGEDGVHIIDPALIQELIVAEEPAASAAPKSGDEGNGDRENRLADQRS